ncbi:MAG: RNA polymerase sigma factor [Thermogutta sp.]
MICIRRIRKKRRTQDRRHRRAMRGFSNYWRMVAVTTMDFSLPDVPGLPPRAEWSDEDLIREYQEKGETKAFEELVRRYERELFGYLCQYLGDLQMAEDAFQSTFMQVHLKCSQFDPERRFRPWLYAVATNQAIDAQRRNRRHRNISLDRQFAAESDGDRSGSLAEIVAGENPDPDDEMQAAERREGMRRAVDALPENLRQVLMLVYYQGLKYREAADILDIPVGTVKSRLHTAVRKLESHLHATHTISHYG